MLHTRGARPCYCTLYLWIDRSMLAWCQMQVIYPWPNAKSQNPKSFCSGVFRLSPWCGKIFGGAANHGPTKQNFRSACFDTVSLGHPSFVTISFSIWIKKLSVDPPRQKQRNDNDQSKHGMGKKSHNSSLTAPALWSFSCPLVFSSWQLEALECL